MAMTRLQALIRSANLLNSATFGVNKEEAAVVMVAVGSGGSQTAAAAAVAAVQVAVSMVVLVAEVMEKVACAIVQTLKVGQPELPKPTCGQKSRWAIREGIYSRRALGL